MKTRWWHKLLLIILSGLLLAFSWYPHGAFILIFFAFVPAIFLSDISLSQNKKNAFGRGLLLFYPIFLIFNIITTYWIGYCTVAGTIAAIVANAFLQTFVFSTWHACRKVVNNNVLQALMLISFWCTFEYLHLNWDLTWPWLNLGNVFAVKPQIIQWYSITGAFGGTIWVLLVNLLAYYYIKSFAKNDKKYLISQFIAFVIVFAAPMIISVVLLNSAKKSISKDIPINAIIVQQNTDPWNEEYRLTNEQQIDRILDVAAPYLNSNINLVIAPESSVAHNISLSDLKNRNFYKEDTRYSGFPKLDSVIESLPELNFVLGLSTAEYFDRKVSPTALNVGTGIYAQFYNTAGFYNKNGLDNYYHKSRLVPGVEKMPFPKLLGFLGDIVIELGGTNSSLTFDTLQKSFTFYADNQPFKIGTAICYESIYGELVRNFVKDGANVLSVITNDSWWSDSEGHVQHFEMARLRAIETRRYVLRAANGGFSGVIDPLGKVLQKSNYNERIALNAEVFAQDCETFYVKHGDYLAKIAVVLTVLCLIYAVFVSILNKIRRIK